jgi:hypothetical protein
MPQMWRPLVKQDDKRVRLVIMYVRVRDKRLEDVIADGRFLHISEIGPACDEMCARIKLSLRNRPREPPPFPFVRIPDYH